MNVFRMNGVTICHQRQFCRHFSPTELLRQRELAAGFAVQALQNLSMRDNYHSSQLYRAVFQPIPTRFQHWTDYNDPFPVEGEEELLEDLWETLLGEDSPSQEQLSLFLILASGYLLAGRTLADTPLNRQEAEAAYARMEAEPVPVRFPAIPPSGPVFLPARATPYRLILDSRAAKSLLDQGSQILPRKLVAATHPQGDPLIPVKIEVYDSPEDTAPQTVTLSAGDYLYCNFVEDVPVFLHPVRTVQGDATMDRQGDLITLSSPHRPPVTIDCAGREILSFCPEGDGLHWVILDSQRLDYRHYSLRDAHKTTLRWAEDIVEISLGPDNVLCLLDKHGRRISTGMYDPYRSTTFPRLSDAEGSGGQ